MMKKIYFTFAVSLVCALCTSSIHAYEDGSLTEYDRLLKATEHKQKLIHGNYPPRFSNDTRSRYWYTAEEKEAESLGKAKKPWPKLEYVCPLTKEDLVDKSKVLVSAVMNKPSAEANNIDKIFERTFKNKKFDPKVNDSRDLYSEVRKHKWSVDSLKMKDAIRSKSNTVDADSKDYEEYFRYRR